MIEVRPATFEDVTEFYGSPPKQSMKGLVVVLDGKPVGIGGLVFSEKSVGFFSVVRPELKPYKMTIYKTARKLAEMAKGCSALAVADPDEPNSKQFLTRLGLIPVAETKFGEVFGWPSSQSRS